MHFTGEHEEPLPDDLASLLEDVLDATMRLQHADLGEVRLRDDATGTLQLVAHRGLGPEFIEHFATEASGDTSACGRALRAGKRVVIEDVATDPGYAPNRAVAALSGYRGVLCTPLFERGGREPIGVLSTFFREPCRPAAQDLQLSDLFARQAADLIASRRAERLRRSEARLQAAVDLVKLGLYSWDPATNAVHWDATVKAMWGIPPDGPIDWDIAWAAIHPDDLARVEAAVAACVVPGGDGVYDIEYRVIGLDGVERWIASRGQTHFEDGRPVSFLGAALDVTQRKMAENELEDRVEARTRQLGDVNAALVSEIEERRQVTARLALVQAELYHAARLSVAGQMAAMIAHELSQPLTAALNSVNAARRLPGSGDPGRDLALRELIEEARGEIERASEIVRRLRSYVRRGSVDRVSEAVAPMVEEAVAFAAVGPNALGVNISQYFDPDAPMVMVDRVQIQQVIANLVRNALEAMNSQSRRDLTVATTAHDDGYLELMVADSGPGVADEMLPNLFEPFLTTKPGGMGLGLSICKSIVEAHGGRIGYAPALNGGATFTFTLLQAPAGTEGE